MMERVGAASYVYILKSGDRYKVGRSKSPKKRLTSIQAMSPTPIELVTAVKAIDASALEARIHKAFGPCRTHGEWFELDERGAAQLFDLVGGGA